MELLPSALARWYGYEKLGVLEVGGESPVVHPGYWEPGDLLAVAPVFPEPGELAVLWDAVMGVYRVAPLDRAMLANPPGLIIGKVVHTWPRV